MADDYYSLLGVARNATEAEIKSAFRRLAMQCHPDKNPGNKEAEEKFRRINGAYEALSDPKKRKIYDRFGAAGLNAGAPGGPGGAAGGGPAGFGAGVDVNEVFGDLFESFFGGRSGGGRASRGADLKYEFEISLEDAFRGAQVPLRFPRVEACAACRGSGAKPGSHLKRCAQCRGSGRVQFSQGFFSMSQTCPRCGGEGQAAEDPCRDCRGAGRVRREHSLKVKIPPGIRDGSTLRIAGEGEAPPRGGEPGDLYVLVRVKVDPRFTRHDDDLAVAVTIDVATAALGGEAAAPTLDGSPVHVRIPAGTQSGTTLRVREKGMPHLQGRGRGDLLVEIRVEIPRELNARQRELFEELRRGLHGDSGGPSGAGDGGSVFGRIFGKE